jgi:hypothetical protein
MQITLHAIAASAILMTFPGAAMAQKSNSAMVAEDMVYRGYRIDFSRVIGHVDLDAAKASLRKQVDMVEAIPLKPAIKDFFRSMRVEVKSELLMESGGQAAGVYRSYYQFVQMIALPSNKTAPVLLHELLHAYHAQVMPQGFKNPDVLTFYERGRESHRYQDTWYVLKNEKEFFAVTASIFLNGTAEHPPYTRAKLKEAQPAYVDWLTKLFGFNPTDTVKPSAPLLPCANIAGAKIGWTSSVACRT